MNKVLVIEPDKCTTCRLCELACTQRNDGVFRPSRARVRVAIDADQAFYFPKVCFQCEDAPCMDACPTKALIRDETTGAVVLVEARCEECGECEPACPYGVIRCFDGKPQKCELCGGDPECVRYCAPGALRFEPQDQWPEAASRAYARRLRELAEETRG
jgi:Fe-S-cluster-containing hydrogenase component 2